MTRSSCILGKLKGASEECFSQGTSRRLSWSRAKRGDNRPCSRPCAAFCGIKRELSEDLSEFLPGHIYLTEC